MVAALLGGTYRDVRLLHVPADYSSSLDEVGSVGAGKVVRMLGVIGRTVAARLRTGAVGLYYVPAGANRSAVLRDTVVLQVLRPWFRTTVFHHHARGLPGAVADLPPGVRTLARRAFRGADVAVAPSQALLDEAVTFGPTHAVVVPNGTPDGAALAPPAAPREHPHVVFLNLLSEAKGAPWLLEALGELRRRGVPFTATFAGAFPTPGDERTFRARARQLGIDGLVTRPGLVVGDRKWRLLRSADVFCVPTTYAQESFGLAMVEAASCGVAVVTTDTPGVREVFEGGTGAVLVDPARREALADVLQELCRDPRRRAELGRAARTRYQERYTLERFRQGMDEVFTNTFG